MSSTESLSGPESKGYTRYAYLLNFYHIVDLSWLSHMMYTITFRISVKYQFSGCIFQHKLTCGCFSIYPFGEVMI